MFKLKRCPWNNWESAHCKIRVDRRTVYWVIMQATTSALSEKESRRYLSRVTYVYLWVAILKSQQISFKLSKYLINQQNTCISGINKNERKKKSHHIKDILVLFLLFIIIFSCLFFSSLNAALFIFFSMRLSCKKKWE